MRDPSNNENALAEALIKQIYNANIRKKLGGNDRKTVNVINEDKS